MGCDIHLYLERLYDGKWVNIDYWQYNRYYNEAEPDSSEPKMYHVGAYQGRNYELFSILAGVRNYGRNKPIKQPRGLPVDISSVTKEGYGDGSYLHTPSWYTMKELYDYYNKHSKTKCRGMLNVEQRKELADGIIPNEWCQGTNQTGYEFAEWEVDNELKCLLDPLKARLKDELYFTYCDDDDPRILETIMKEGNNIRIVFWFDN